MPISNPSINNLSDISTMQTTAPLCAPGGRLTLSSSNPTGDGSNTTLLYYLPYVHSLVPLWNAAANAWEYRSIPDSGISINRVGDNPRNADIYATFNDALPGGLGIDIQSWASDTTRAIPRSRKSGIQILTYNSGDQPIKTLLGTIRMIGANGNAKMYDTDGKRFVSNAYNRVRKRLLLLEGTATWNVTLNSWTNWNNNSANRLEVVSCDADPVFDVGLKVRAAGNPNTYLGSGIAVDNVVSPEVYTFGLAGDTNLITLFTRPIGIGYHYLAPLLMSTAGTAVTVYGGVDTTFFGTWDC